jgi:hypothetical protein
MGILDELMTQIGAHFRRTVLVMYGEIVARSAWSTGLALGGDRVGGVGDVTGGGVHDAVGDQLVELDDLLLVVGVVVADELPAEHQPVREAVELLVAVGDLGDLVPEPGL